MFLSDLLGPFFSGVTGSFILSIYLGSLAVNERWSSVAFPTKFIRESPGF